MKLSDFDYNLPKELIAQYPLKDRLSCRLLVLNRQKKSIEHRNFLDLADYFKKDDLLVLNDSKVLTCRLQSRRATGGKVEILLLNERTGLSFEALIKPARIKVGEKITFDDQKISCVLSARNEVTFYGCNKEEIYNSGVIPLPPYIKRAPQDLDKIYYQTVYAKEEGSVASPTAGLHFTEEFLRKIEELGINIAYLTLHVGQATFKPVKCDDVAKHKMGKEYFRIENRTLKLIEEAQATSAKICAVGTTSCRVLETYAAGKSEGYTDLFIYPGFQFKIVGRLLTNFHLPRTTLFMLVSAFAGEKLTQKAYREAVEKKYRFYSYGDAMLIL